jgi:predicted nucleic-acid-binding protein
MKITADTNLLVRAITADDARQARVAQTALANAELVALTTASLCELVWVLSSGYDTRSAQIGGTIRTLLASANVVANRAEVEAGLAALDAGADFADGVIAFQGASLGADTFASFDKKAVKRLEQLKQNALLLA